MAKRFYFSLDFLLCAFNVLLTQLMHYVPLLWRQISCALINYRVGLKQQISNRENSIHKTERELLTIKKENKDYSIATQLMWRTKNWTDNKENGTVRYANLCDGYFFSTKQKVFWLVLIQCLPYQCIPTELNQNYVKPVKDTADKTNSQHFRW